ncbi:hypothetical protein KP803_06705 [Vibrio sp. ZSDE26]|uniref:Uncharacterized protein n=1 Tax=Vibrio amylolyticus TaxID=2847292 RepID=A0A9X1XJG8_9VIBR|nr:hypothetical protein [Vibrio amylolyticus]MCK6262968.1 hypothetical protein [Vibrio amylolyticus]
MPVESNENATTEEATAFELAIGFVVLFSGPLLMTASFSSGFWFYDIVPNWLVKLMLLIGGLISLITINWKWTVATFGALTLAFNYMPGGEDPLDTWIPMINSPQVGDVYAVNTFLMTNTEPTDDNAYVIYRVSQFTESDITFNKSGFRYTLDHVNEMLKDKSIYQIPYYEETFTLPKHELIAAIQELEIGGVFRNKKGSKE